MNKRSGFLTKFPLLFIGTWKSSFSLRVVGPIGRRLGVDYFLKEVEI